MQRGRSAAKALCRLLSRDFPEISVARSARPSLLTSPIPSQRSVLKKCLGLAAIHPSFGSVPPFPPLGANLSQSCSFSAATSSGESAGEPTAGPDASTSEGGEAAAEPGVIPEGATEMEDMVTMLEERDVELQEKNSAIEKLKNSLLSSYAEMENVRDRNRKEMENARRFAVQGFAKDLLDVADNLGRAVGLVPNELRTPQGSKAGGEGQAVKVLHALVEGVLITEKQMMQVFKKNGLVCYDPQGEAFDPNHHNAVFEVKDSMRPEGTVASVLKTGYKLHDRVVRPAEVGVYRVK